MSASASAPNPGVVAVRVSVVDLRFDERLRQVHSMRRVGVDESVVIDVSGLMGGIPSRLRDQPTILFPCKPSPSPSPDAVAETQSGAARPAKATDRRDDDNGGSK